MFTGPLCRSCGSASLATLGRIPPARVFAGQVLDPPWAGGTLHRCRSCGLGQRHPLQPAGEYERLYAQAPADVWVGEQLRVDQARVRDAILKAPAQARVLDVGCYDGALLGTLPPAMQRFGIEPSAAAAGRARARGVTVLAASLEALEGAAQALPAEGFDVVTAVDVIEHVPNPSDTLSRMARLLAPGGHLLVSTGSLDAAAWKWAGGRFWYCSFPEHISFASEQWARYVAPLNQLDLTSFETFRYDADDSGRPAWKMKFAFGRQWLRTRLAEGLAAVRGRPLEGRAAQRILGSQGLFEDHVLMGFRRRAR